MNQVNETKDIELRIIEVKKEMERLCIGMAGHRKPERLVSSYISDIDDKAITREEYYKLLVKKKMELKHDVDVNVKMMQKMMHALFERAKRRK